MMQRMMRPWSWADSGDAFTIVMIGGNPALTDICGLTASTADPAGQTTLVPACASKSANAKSSSTIGTWTTAVRDSLPHRLEIEPPSRKLIALRMRRAPENQAGRFVADAVADVIRRFREEEDTRGSAADKENVEGEFDITLTRHAEYLALQDSAPPPSLQSCKVVRLTRTISLRTRTLRQRINTTIDVE